MRVSTRILLLKVGAAAAVLALFFAVMHFVLPGVARRNLQAILGPDYVRRQREGLELWAPRDTPLAPLAAKGTEAFAAALYAEYGEALALEPLKEKERITVVLFKTQEELASFGRRRMKQDLSHASGFYDPVSWRIALTLQPERQLLKLVFHETTHLLMDRSSALGEARWSLWLGEGMAVFFEHSAVAPTGIRLGGIDRRQAARIVLLARRRGHVPLRELLSGGAELFHSDRGTLCYHESGTLVAYLLEGAGGRHRSGFLRYYHAERQRGPASPRLLEESLGISIEQLEAEWLAFLQRTLR